MGKITNIDTFKHMKEVGLVEPPTRKEVMNKIQAIRDKYEELDMEISKVIDDIDSIKKSKKDYSDPWKQLTLDLRVDMANSTDELLEILENELI